MRRWGELIDGRSLWWTAIARNKRLVALDLRLRRGPGGGPPPRPTATS